MLLVLRRFTFVHLASVCQIIVRNKQSGNQWSLRILPSCVCGIVVGDHAEYVQKACEQFEKEVGQSYPQTCKQKSRWLTVNMVFRRGGQQQDRSDGTTGKRRPLDWGLISRRQMFVGSAVARQWIGSSSSSHSETGCAARVQCLARISLCCSEAATAKLSMQ